jgi:hypothetical protein
MYKILIASPTSKHKDYCFYKWRNHLQKITYPTKVLLVDNTKDEGYYSNWLKKSFQLVIHVDWKPEDYLYSIITRSQNIIRNYTLYNNYEYLFLLESDQFPPVNVIEYLLSLSKRVCALPYFTYTAFQSKLLQFDIEDFGNTRDGRTMNLDKTFLNWDGLVKPKIQPGIGCLLIHRSVLSKIIFRCDKDHASDTYFHEDLNNLGIQCYVSELNFSEHQNSNWFEIIKNNG